MLLAKRMLPAPPAGAAPVVRLVPETGTGRYFNMGKEEPILDEPELAQHLWDQAKEMTGAG
jgi:hypothetical protein